jgi:hypothetical protein
VRTKNTVAVLSSANLPSYLDRTVMASELIVCGEPETSLQPKLATRNAFEVSPLKPDFGLSGKTSARE